jgi:hypothetical protein
LRSPLLPPLPRRLPGSGSGGNPSRHPRPLLHRSLSLLPASVVGQSPSAAGGGGIPVFLSRWVSSAGALFPPKSPPLRPHRCGYRWSSACLQLPLLLLPCHVLLLLRPFLRVHLLRQVYASACHLQIWSKGVAGLLPLGSAVSSPLLLGSGPVHSPAPHCRSDRHLRGLLASGEVGCPVSLGSQGGDGVLGEPGDGGAYGSRNPP